MATKIEIPEYICKIHKIAMEIIYLKDSPDIMVVCEKCSPLT